MIAAQGILTSRGGKTSHAAVVARGMGKTCVCGAEELEVDTKRRRFTAPGGTVVEEGDVISIDGSTGEVYLGEVPVVPSPVVALLRGRDRRRRRGRRRPRARGAPDHGATPTRSGGCGVRANADTAEDAARARRFGAQGIGLCRTEHMFLGERRQLVERLILAEDDDEREPALDALLPLQRAGLRRDLRGDGRAAGHHPAARPAAARVPARPHRAVRAGRARRGARASTTRATCGCCRRAARCTSRTRCSGCAACGSAWSSPACSPCRSGRSPRRPPSGKKAGGDPRPEIMVPLVGAVQELEAIREEATKVLDRGRRARGQRRARLRSAR